MTMVGVAVAAAVGVIEGVADGLKVGEGMILVAVTGTSNGIAVIVRVFSILSAFEQPKVVNVKMHKTKTMTRISLLPYMERGNAGSLAAGDIMIPHLVDWGCCAILD